MGVRVAFAAAAVILLAASASARTAGADPPVAGYPNSIAALGDSITQAADSTSFGDNPNNSWATGTNASVNSVYSRLLAVNPAISGNRYNDSVSGARMADLNGQAVNAVSQGAELVTILIGANDVCTSSEATMTAVATFQSQFEQAMQTLSSGLPEARIAVASIPDVYNLWAILHDNGSARFIWGLASICQSLLANPTSMAAPDVQRRANVRQRNMDLNDVLRDVCAEYIHCKFDGYAAFNMQFVPGDVSTLDYFHPSLQGQALAAQTAWDNVYDFTDSTPPVSTSTGAASPGGITVTLSGSDASGLSGIEYRLGLGAYQRYVSPAFVPLDTQITWRAVDVSGNTEGSHTCTALTWAWQSDDQDCDAFSDAAETFAGTEESVACAATPAANDEPGPDAWPLDFDDNQRALLSDITRFGAVFNSVAPGSPYDARFDLNGDGKITLADVTRFAPFFNKSCAG